jgi:hypothetical protein
MWWRTSLCSCHLALFCVCWSHISLHCSLPIPLGAGKW